VVKEVNGALTNNPEIINSDPYGQGWMVKLSEVNLSEVESLLDANSYQEITKSA
jgi:glycine cleavage system H protein